jgi:hypothetical protein
MQLTLGLNGTMRGVKQGWSTAGVHVGIIAWKIEIMRRDITGRSWRQIGTYQRGGAQQPLFK